MRSTVRPRSVSRSRIIKQSDIFLSGQALDPYALLEDVLKNLNSTDIPLAVVLTDGESSISYLLSVFLSKEYEVNENRVHFGFKTMDVSSLRAKIEFNVDIDADT